ncbi:hypothetical protein P154DRAFT_530013 [Amniculicola lignicola CBS 123094]|uniref:Uncharacterized protein n=1 Tax=Amniculicola lignicola CBS 123094 TaxID=1392246 RepID=A0A6A5WXB6_9PLEO|nr:hypothetical protein P154DRAFT_530013 [Amniculicola lignicola CBS 123094]
MASNEQRAVSEGSPSSQASNNPSIPLNAVPHPYSDAALGSQQPPPAAGSYLDPVDSKSANTQDRPCVPPDLGPDVEVHPYPFAVSQPDTAVRNHGGRRSRNRQRRGGKGRPQAPHGGMPQYPAPGAGPASPPQTTIGATQHKGTVPYTPYWASPPRKPSAQTAGADDSPYEKSTGQGWAQQQQGKFNQKNAHQGPIFNPHVAPYPPLGPYGGFYSNLSYQGSVPNHVASTQVPNPYGSHYPSNPASLQLPNSTLGYGLGPMPDPFQNMPRQQIPYPPSTTNQALSWAVRKYAADQEAAQLLGRALGADLSGGGTSKKTALRADAPEFVPGAYGHETKGKGKIDWNFW